MRPMRKSDIKMHGFDIKKTGCLLGAALVIAGASVWGWRHLGRDVVTDQPVVATFDRPELYLAPVVSAPKSIRMLRNSVSEPIAFSVTDVDTPKNMLSIAVYSVDERIISNKGGVSHTCYSDQCFLNISSGMETGLGKILVQANDGVYASRFEISVLVMDELDPFLGEIRNVAVEAGGGSSPRKIMVDDWATGPESVVLVGLSDNPTLVRPEDMIFSGEGTERMVSIKTRPRTAGEATIRIVAQDPEGNSAVQTFALRITASHRGREGWRSEGNK